MSKYEEALSNLVDEEVLYYPTLKADLELIKEAIEKAQKYDELMKDKEMSNYWVGKVIEEKQIERMRNALAKINDKLEEGQE